MFTPELQKRAGGYENYVKSLGPWDLKVIDGKIIYNGGNSVRIQIISESKAVFNEGTVVRRFNETMMINKSSSGWKIADVLSTVKIDEKIIQ